MSTLGFSELWCNLIMDCVSTVKYQVLINGNPYGDITPTRGIRQGDPLSPCLFVICTEMLVQKLLKAESRGEITGLKVARGAPAISHLLYADDSLFYCKQSDAELNRLNEILQEYSLASGQQINYQKSSIYFGKNIPSERRELIKLKLGMEQEGGEGIYLGLPEFFGGSKVRILSFFKQRLDEKVGGWQNQFLSPGGKEVLLKAVALALPTYTMSCFLIPKTICKQISSIMSDYWWRNNKTSRGMHWKSWEHKGTTVDQPSLDGLYQKIWKQQTSPKVHHFLWRCISDALPTAATMKRRHISKEGRCMRCSMENETANHILFQCPYARLVWAMSPIHAPPDGIMSESLYSNLCRVLSLQAQYPQEDVNAELIPWLLWRIWKNRNAFVFQNKDYVAPDTVNKAIEDMKEWEGRKEESVEVKKSTTGNRQCKDGSNATPTVLGARNTKIKALVG